MLRKFSKRWFYGMVSLLTAVIVIISNPLASYARISWVELLLRGVQVIQLSTISLQQEVNLGRQINQELISQRKVKIYNDPAINRYINTIGQKLARNSSRTDIPYTFQVVDDKSINAFATMGGFVYVNTGLIATAENESELASVIGHEIAHVAARHSVKQMREQAISQGVLSVAGLDRNTAVQLGVELAFNLPHSRGDELEADELGLANLKKAGYATSGMITFFEKLLEKSGGSPPSFLSTHPATSSRIRRLQEMIDPKTSKVGHGLNTQVYRNKIKSLL